MYYIIPYLSYCMVISPAHLINENHMQMGVMYVQQLLCRTERRIMQIHHGPYNEITTSVI